MQSEQINKAKNTLEINDESNEAIPEKPSHTGQKTIQRPTEQCLQASTILKKMMTINRSYSEILYPFIQPYLSDDASQIGFGLGEHYTTKTGKSFNGFSNFPFATAGVHKWIPSENDCNIVSLNYSTKLEKKELVRGITKSVPYYRVYAIIFDFDNHRNVDKDIFFSMTEELYYRVPEDFRPNIVSKSHGGKGVHWHFFFETPVEIKASELGQLKYYLIQNVFSSPFRYSPFVIDLKGAAGINVVNKETIERLNSEGNPDFKLDVLLQINEFVNPELYKQKTGKEKQIKSPDLDKIRHSKIKIPTELFCSPDKPKKGKTQPSLDSYSVAIPFVEMETIVNDLGLQLENNYKEPKIVLKDLAYEFQQILSEKTKSAIMKIKSPLFLNEYRNDDHNGYIKILVNARKTLVKLFVYSNAAQCEILTLTAKATQASQNKRKTEKTLKEIICEYLDEIGANIKSDGTNVYCSHSFVVMSNIKELDVPSVLSNNELNNLAIIIKQFVKDREYYSTSAISANEIALTLSAIGSDNAFCPEIEKFNEYQQSYVEKLQQNPDYNPAAKIASFWPDARERKLVEITLKNFVLMTMQQFVFGVDDKSLVKRFYVDALPSFISAYKIDMTGNAVNSQVREETSKLFSNYFSKIILWFVGTSGVGKSKLIAALTKPLSKPNLDLTYDTQGNPIDENDTFAFCEKMIVRLSEVKEINADITNKLKRSSGASQLTYRKLYERPTSSNIRGVAIVDSNTSELNKDATNGLNNRILPLICPDVPLLFCTYKDNNVERQQYVQNGTYVGLENNPIFQDLWGYAWNELKEGRYYPEFDLTFKQAVYNQNTCDMYVPDQITFLSERMVTDITKEQAEKANKDSRQYIILDLTVNAFIAKITELCGLGTKVKKDDTEAIKLFLAENFLIRKNINEKGRNLGSKVTVVLKSEGLQYSFRQDDLQF